MQTEPVPAFFIPGISTDELEAVYAALGGANAPKPGKRIYSITYRHNGETWTATVGKTLRGTKLQKRTSRGKKIVREMPVSNGSTVVAIFPGVPFRVFHDGASRVWENPFFAAANEITYFSE